MTQGAQVVSLQLGLSSADAEDLAQNVMLDLQTSKLLDRLGDSSSPRSYLQVVLRNRARDLVRKKQREQDLARERWAGPVVEERLEHDIYQAEALRTELRQLSVEDWDLVKLRFWEGLTIAEIAKRREEPYSRVAVRLFRLGKRLADRLGGGRSEKRLRQN